MKTGTTDSFFSGHTSTTAALIPPAFVGYHRYRGLKHFPTDIAFGTTIGAAVGILNSKTIWP